MSNKIININGFSIGGDYSYIIADIGSNHMQDLSLAKESIDAASEAGADAVKFQSVDLDALYTNPDPDTADFIKKLEFPEEWHPILADYCKKKGVVFFSSPTYLKAVDLLEDVEVPLYKLASAQVGTFPQIIEKVASLNKPTILSTGIANYNEIINAVRIFEEAGNDRYMILHCNSIYPVPADKVNLPLMETYKHMFDCPVGFSDHTDGIHVPIAAVVKGASIIEKHFTLDKGFDAPDSTSFAADPEEFKRLVKQVREVEESMKRRDTRLDIQAEEKDFKKSIIYRTKLNRDIAKGEEINYDDLEYTRSKEGIDCREAFINRTFGKAKRDLASGTILNYELIDQNAKK